METHSRASPVGRTVAQRFEITRPIARGTMGRVYLATQHPLGRKVALKVLDVRGMSSSSDFDGRFTKEAAVLAQLDHPSVVKIYDHGRDEDVFYLAMEYCDGPTLGALIKDKGRIDALRAVSIARQVAAGLHQAHKIGVVHRDLKPGNIIITQSGGRDLPKVLDFGLVKTEDGSDATLPGMMLGTPNYMSPEQISGSKVDGRADLYAIGVILFLMIAGEKPFKAPTRTAVLSAHLTKKPRSLRKLMPDLPPCIDWTIQRCLEKHPDDRFADMEQLASALNACELALSHASLREMAIGLRDGVTLLPPELEHCDGVFDGVVAAPSVPSGPGSETWIGGLVLLLLAGFVAAASVFLVVFATLMFLFGPGSQPSVIPPSPIAVPTLGEAEVQDVGQPDDLKPVREVEAVQPEPAPSPRPIRPQPSGRPLLHSR